jgi:ureidoglycolate amidohydrolase
MALAIDSARLSAELDALGQISEAPPPVVTRVVFSEADLRARSYFKALCHDAGLVVREDAVGNTFAQWPGESPELAPLATGSHIDAIPNAGRFDGTVGVLGGLEAIRALQRAGARPKRSIELIAFTSEEPTRFGIGCLGSRLLGGVLDPSAGSTLRGKDGLTLNEARAAGGFSGSLESVRLKPGHYAAFVELHIEQGPLLEQRGIPLGVVSSIAAPASLRLTIDGEGGHAGAVLMPARHDAFLAAAEIALALEGAAKSSGAIDSVATTGVCDVFPGAVNSIPSRVKLEIDVRDIVEARRDAVLRALDAACTEVSVGRGVRVQTEVINADAPAECATQVMAALERAASKHALPFMKMVSRAYHDSLFMARIAPTGMLFIPCRGGVSHRPDEYASPEAIAQGSLVLAEALLELANSV